MKETIFHINDQTWILFDWPQIRTKGYGVKAETFVGSHERSRG